MVPRTEELPLNCLGLKGEFALDYARIFQLENFDVTRKTVLAEEVVG